MSVADDRLFAGSSALARIVPLGLDMLLIRFAETLSEAANRRAIAFAVDLERHPIAGVSEVVPSLVSVAVRFETGALRDTIAGEIRLRMARLTTTELPQTVYDIDIVYDGDDLAEVAEALNLTPEAFVAMHLASRLRVLATGFAPGFIYCGFHPESLSVQRRQSVRPQVGAGTVLFAARQTAITATAVPTGWSVIGHTRFRNFDQTADPVLRARAGDTIRFIPS